LKERVYRKGRIVIPHSFFLCLMMIRAINWKSDNRNKWKLKEWVKTWHWGKNKNLILAADGHAKHLVQYDSIFLTVESVLGKQVVSTTSHQI
jgi:hypothetical protein